MTIIEPDVDNANTFTGKTTLSQTGPETEGMMCIRADLQTDISHTSNHLKTALVSRTAASKSYKAEQTLLESQALYCSL